MLVGKVGPFWSWFDFWSGVSSWVVKSASSRELRPDECSRFCLVRVEPSGAVCSFAHRGGSSVGMNVLHSSTKQKRDKLLPNGVNLHAQQEGDAFSEEWLEVRECVGNSSGVASEGAESGN